MKDNSLEILLNEKANINKLIEKVRVGLARSEIKGVFHLRLPSYQPILYSAFTLEEIQEKFNVSLTKIRDGLWSVDAHDDFYVELIDLSYAADLKLRRFFE